MARGLLGRSGLLAMAGAAVMGLASVGHGQLDLEERMGPMAPEDIGVERFTLPNGMRVIMRKVDACGYATIVTLFGFGEASDPEGKSGMARLNSRLYITSAAGEIPARSIAEWASAYQPPEETNGAVGEEYIALSTKFTSDKLEGELMEVATRLSGVRPVESDLERERATSLESIRGLNQNLPASIAYLWTRELMRPSPEGFRFGGVAEQVRAISLADAKSHLEYFCPANTTLVVVGALEPVSTRAFIENKLGTLPAGKKAPAPRAFDAPMLGARKDVAEPTDRTEYQGRTIATLGYDPPSPDDPMYAAFQVLIGYLYLEAQDFNAFPEPGRAVAALQVMYRTVEDNELVQIAGLVAENADAEKAIEELRAFVKMAAWSFEASHKVNFDMARGAFRWFGLAEADLDVMCESQFPLAFGMGRLEQMGLQTGGALVRSFQDVTMNDLRKCAERVFGAGKDATVVVKGLKPEGEAPAEGASPAAP